jgi:hypothetical protein
MEKERERGGRESEKASLKVQSEREIEAHSQKGT